MTAAQFFGGLLIAAGALIALLCGACTALVIIGSFSVPDSGGGQNYGGGAMTGVALLIGGVPTLIGCLIVWGGVVLFRSGRKPPPPPVNPETFN